MSREWMNEFIEKLSSIEGQFEVYTSVFLKYENQYVFAIKDVKDWIEVDNKRKASLSAFGGRLGNGVDIIQFLKSCCSSEIGVNIDLVDSTHTYIDYQHRLKKIPIDLVKGEIRPHMITIVQKTRYSSSPNTLIFSYQGNTRNQPQALQSSALLLARESVLVQMFKNEKTVLSLKKTGAVLVERIKIPDQLYLYPYGSLNSLLRYLSYEVF